MSYKDLLVVLDSDASAHVRIEIAAALAERFRLTSWASMHCQCQKLRGISAITIQLCSTRFSRN